ncbi:thiosulfate dehydrogenase [quinone] large subunit [Tenacibaculum lutimaris]|uniref:Thiosulfate dehydrogenase [quinone] large subunit n=1 Tax=Tenacibaculum lutimaris TaxID=285258 RepID=A0A420DZJ8_9FLAO|nr:TQO small subunit DoxD [Tenacibaculum lutimaris]RKF03269.1 thiosulfate dehydrogenase [quinone] large subunit [Tenacibaculum lutimaris]
MISNNIKNDSGLLALAIRLVIGWTYFSAFWRRTILANKLDPEVAGYIGEKFNHFLPNALGIKPLIQYLVENPDILWLNMVIFTIIEGIVGLFIIFGLFTRIMSIGVFGLAMGILLGSGWIGTTCLDEWQIGVLGIATGYVLFLTGSGKYSLDNYFMKNNFSFTNKKWFAWLGSGILPIKNNIFPRFVLIGSLAILGMTLFTNQVFHGGVWGTLHNKSVKPKLEITEGKINNDTLSFDVFRTEGVDVYGSWVIAIEVLDQNNKSIVQYTQKELASLADQNISNYYVAKIKPGKHSLVVPLGAKAKMTFSNQVFSQLSNGTYTVKITDISGAFWTHQITK